MSNQYNSIAELFTSCPFDHTYTHTLEPMSISNRLSWLERNAGYTASQDRFTQLMLVRLDTATDKGTLRLTCLDSKAASYNYAYINNKNGAYFCFITGYRYINDATQGNASTSVYEFDLEIDVLASYVLSSSQLKTCMVARQHAVQDPIYGNLVPEPVSINNYLRKNMTDITSDLELNDYLKSMPVFGVMDPDNSALIDRIYSGLSLRCFSMMDPFGISNCREWLKAHAGDEDVIFGYMVPRSLVNSFYNIDWNATEKGKAAPRITGYAGSSITLTLPALDENIDIYTPKNKKLLSYPYKYRILTDGNGTVLTFKNELWNSASQQHLHLYFNVSPTPAIRIVPYDYDNARIIDGSIIKFDHNENKDMVMTINDFPMVSWGYSAFEQWISRSLIGSTAKAIMDFGTYSRDNSTLGNPQSTVNLVKLLS